ncbi:MAG: lysylphosphatidylglycerol synthase domain-containing protein [Candidatus Micrarchaeia archaeon]
MTKLDLKKLVYLSFSLIVAFALYKLFGAENALGEANFTVLLLSLLLFLANVLFWNFAWASVAKIPYKEANAAGFSSLAGFLTPLGVGSDFLRGFFASKTKSLPVLLASSFATKIYKLSIAAILLLASLPLFFNSVDERIRFALVASTSAIFSAVIVFKVFRIDKWKVTQSFLAGSIGGKARDVYKNLHALLVVPSLKVVAFLFFSLAFEFAAFYTVFAAFGIFLPASQSVSAFLMLFLASKAFLPQGFGVVEAVGLLLFEGVFATPVLAAVILSWDAVRAWIPAVLSFVFAFLRRGSRT